MGDTYFGTLNDVEIKKAVSNNELIISNYLEGNVKQACYELRAGNIYYDLSKNIAAGGEKHTISDNESIIFRPHQTIVIITKEKIKLPNNILARVLTKGILFSVGLSPVNTYADPGFFGHLGIVLNNVSNNYIKIDCGESIAKIEFDRLEAPVQEPYHGQHSFESSIWPVQTDYILEKENIKKYIGKPNEIKELEFAFGKPVADIMKRILKTERQFLFATVALLIANCALIGVTGGAHWLSNVQAALVGILSNTCFLILSFLIDKGK